MILRTAALGLMLACMSTATFANGATDATAAAAGAQASPPPAATAPVAAPATPASPAAARPDPEEKVCKVEREIGSNRLKRVCRTRQQIDDAREAAREAISREQKN